MSEKHFIHIQSNLHRLTERDSRLAHFISLNFRDPHFGLFWGSGLLLGYLATSNVKSDVRFLLSDPDFLLGRLNFASILLSYRDPHFGLFRVFWGFGGI